MEEQDITKLEDRISALYNENRRLKKNMNWMAVFIVMFFIIQIYNLIFD